MPSVALTVSPHGLILKASINHSNPRQDAIKAAGGTVPAWHTIDLLVDTGASMTALDPSVCTTLGLVSHSVTPMHTPSTGTAPVLCPTYDIAMYILPTVTGGMGHYIDALAVVEADFAAQPIDGLLGRDVLANCVLTYIGHSGIFVLSY